MKMIKSTFCAVVLAGTVFGASSSFAGSKPMLYVHTHDNHFTASVYHDGKPVQNAVVKVYTSGLEPNKEVVTNESGQVNIYPEINAGTFKAVAETPHGTSSARWFKPGKDK